MIGARVLKTSLAVMLSILTARLLDLNTPQFAGIVAILAVQPSLYRSLRYGMQHTISAIIGAILAAFVMFEMGNSFLVIGLVVLFLMAMHVKLRTTNSLLISAVVAVNTMGSASLYFGESAINQIALVLIGVGIGTFINLFPKPFHQERASHLLSQSEGMIRVLLHYMHIELSEGRVTPYPAMREQINEVRVYIERGKEISGYIGEDERYRPNPRKNPMQLFQTLETMVERVRDVSKELQKLDLSHPEVEQVKRYLLVVIQAQEAAIAREEADLAGLETLLEESRNRLWQSDERMDNFVARLAVYNVYGYLREYVREINNLAENGKEGKLVASTAMRCMQAVDAG